LPHLCTLRRRHCARREDYLSSNGARASGSIGAYSVSPRRQRARSFGRLDRGYTRLPTDGMVSPSSTTRPEAVRRLPRGLHARDLRFTICSLQARLASFIAIARMTYP
jgi:hypothetical protein